MPLVPVTITLGGRQLTFSPLKLAEIRSLNETLAAIREDKITGMEALLSFSPHFYTSVRKVHQDLTQQQLEELMTVDDIQSAQRAMMEASGLKAAKEGEATPVTV